MRDRVPRPHRMRAAGRAVSGPDWISYRTVQYLSCFVSSIAIISTEWYRKCRNERGVEQMSKLAGKVALVTGGNGGPRIPPPQTVLAAGATGSNTRPPPKGTHPPGLRH